MNQENIEPMTFSETIDALIPIYEEGMKAESYGDLVKLNLENGICTTAYRAPILCELKEDSEFWNYKPCRRCAWWFEPPHRIADRPISEIIDQCIRPRLELLKRIQKDLEKK